MPVTAQRELHIRLLGDFRVVAGDEPITSLNTPRLQALFTYLLLHRDSPQGRRHMAFLFWPDSSERQARTNLRNLLMALRHALPDLDCYVCVERQTLQWRSDVTFDLDVDQFEKALAESDRQRDSSAGQAEHDLVISEEASRVTITGGQGRRSLQRAVDLYTGDLLPSCYDEWILPARDRLREDFLAALARLVQLLEQDGELAAALLYGQRLLRHDPLREENYRLVMRLHLALGDRAGVANVFRSCERTMRRELGATPSQATVDLLRQAERLSAPEEGKLRYRRRGSRTSETAAPVPERNPASPSFLRAKGSFMPGNLPAQTNPFIGREAHVSALSDLVRRNDVRLVTLTGTAGTGKTRLALQVAFGFSPASRQARERASPGLFPDGAYFVALASLAEADRDLVLQAIGKVLGLAESSAMPLWDTLRQALQEKKILLVLDNFEHLLPAAPLVSDLLSACPDLKVLVTSRASLNLRGEREYVVPPMLVPSHDSPARTSFMPDELLQHETMALFVDRASEVFPTFALNRDNAKAVADICRKLEGLPLAIELAAARVKVLRPEAILSRLDRRLKLLVGGRLDLPPRQRALETAIDWSYNLLSQTEQSQFRKLAVFSGGCTLEAAEAVLGQGSRRQPGSAEYSPVDSVLENITSLVSKSLLSRVDAGIPERPVRFTMLETIREYALEKLRGGSEEETTQREHALYFVALAEEAEPHLVGPQQGEWMDRLEDERDNFRAALRWTREGGKKQEAGAEEAAEIGLRIVGALWRLWMVRGDHREAQEQFTQTLAVARSLEYNRAAIAGHTGYGLHVPPKRRAPALTRDERPTGVWQLHLAKALYGAGNMAYQLDDFSSARSLYEQSLAIRQEIGDRQGTSQSLHSLGVVVKAQGDYPLARSLYEEALDIRREIGDKQGAAMTLQSLGYLVYLQGDYDLAKSLIEQGLAIGREVGDKWIIAWALYHLGLTAQAQEDYEKARTCFEHSLTVGREIGNRGGVAQTIGNLGSVARSLGDYASARSLYKQSLSLLWEIRGQYGIAVCLVGLGELTVAEGALVEGARLLGAAEAIVEALGASLAGDGRRVYERGVATARQTLGEVEFEKARAEGRAMTVEDALELAHSLT